MLSVSSKLFRTIILAGGFGTRLRTVCPACPKPMVPVAGQPFLHYVVENLIGQGIEDIVLSTGYKGEQIQDYFERLSLRCRIRCVREENALGTGGALAYVLLKTDPCEWVLAANGDSLTAFNIEDMIASIQEGADAALVGVRVPDAQRFGSLILNPDDTLAGFLEKKKQATAGLINGGVYLFRRSMLPASAPQEPVSLESDYMPQWLREGKRIAVLRSERPFIDIGTPESLAEAPAFIAGCNLSAQAQRVVSGDYF
jgi:NDP-sugar pyrophosphorylase family protein